MPEFEELYRKYYRDIWLYIMTLTKDPHLTDDITAETFLKAYRIIRKFRGDSDIRTWLCSIARNEFYDWCRKNHRTVSVAVSDSEDVTAKERDSRVSVSTEDQVENKIRAEEIEKILSKMNDLYREVFVMRVYEELSFAEIAEALGKTEGWARVTFFRAKRKIQSAMEDEGWEN